MSTKRLVYRGWRAAWAAVFLAPFIGCSTFGEPTALKSWSVALTAYQSAAQTMAAYCAEPAASRDACVAAAAVSKQTDLVILATKDKLADPSATLTDAELAAATASVNAALPLLTHGGK